MSHESGLMRDPPGTDWEGPRYQGDPAPTWGRLRYRRALPPNAQPKYSNIGYQLLGEIVTRAPVTGYAEYVREHILSRWGCRAPGFRRCAARSSAAGHRLWPARFQRRAGAGGRAARLPGRGRPALDAFDDLARWIDVRSCTRPAISATACCRPRRCGRCTGPAIWATTPGRRRSGSAGMRSAVALTCGCSTAAIFTDSPRTSASTRAPGGCDRAGQRRGEPALMSMELATIAREAIAAVPVRFEPPHRRRRAIGPCSAYTAVTHELVLAGVARRALTFLDPTMATGGRRCGRPRATMLRGRPRACGRRESPACFTGGTTAAWIR